MRFGGIRDTQEAAVVARVGASSRDVSHWETVPGHHFLIDGLPCMGLHSPRRLLPMLALVIGALSLAPKPHNVVAPARAVRALRAPHSVRALQSPGPTVSPHPTVSPEPTPSAPYGTPVHTILCPSQASHPNNYCDCGGDCHSQPSWCDCPEAVSCCGGAVSQARCDHHCNSMPIDYILQHEVRFCT